MRSKSEAANQFVLSYIGPGAALASRSSGPLVVVSSAELTLLGFVLGNFSAQGQEFTIEVPWVREGRSSVISSATRPPSVVIFISEVVSAIPH